MAKVVVVYGEGVSKKHSVRMTGLKCEAGEIALKAFGDIYITNDLLAGLGATAESQIRVTFERV